jgi:hypothetical protein
MGEASDYFKEGVMTKYHNIPQIYNGQKFDSKRELSWYLRFRNDSRVKAIDCQVRFLLVPAQKDGKRVIERAVSYVLDFLLTMADGSRRYIDAKGKRTKDYVIKRKLMLWIHGIRIEEV